MTFTDPIVADTVLVRPAIQSPDYVPGSAGWSINDDGSAEFSDATMRGSMTAGDWFVGPGDPLGSIVADSAVVGRWAVAKAFVQGVRDLVTSARWGLYGIVNDSAGLTKYAEAFYDEQADQDHLSLYGGFRSGSPTTVDVSSGGVVTINGLRVLAGYNGLVNVTTNSSGVGTTVVVFPAAFAANPNVQLTLVTPSGSGVKADFFVVSLSPSQMTVRLDLAGATAITLQLHWQAVPMQ